MEPPDIHYLIVGQGLAGTLLSWELHKKNIPFLVIDNSHHDSSSMVAAGLLQPVTGPRLVLTPGFEEYYAQARVVYSELEDLLKEQFFFETPFIRVFHTPAELVYWNQNRRLKTNLPYIKDVYSAQHWLNINDSLGSVEFLKSGWCDLPKLLGAYQTFLTEKNLLIREPLNYSDILIKDTHVEWKNIKAQKIIFCEGWQAQNNPWFKHLPFNNAKGEILTVDIPDIKHRNHIFSGNKWICPAGQHFKTGSTFTWDELNSVPTENGKRQILNGLKTLIQTPVTVMNHKAGVRPIFKDRKPRLEFHSEHPQLGIFNGLGSKGSLVGPLYAKNFATRLSY